MSLSFVTRSGSYEARWIDYALLRDNILHHLDNGRPSESFNAIYRVTEALGGHSVKLPAKALFEQLSQAKQVLCPLPISELAVSQRTRAAISLSWPPQALETHLAKDVMGGIKLYEGSPKSLSQVFGYLVDILLQLTQGLSSDDVIEVSDI